MPVRGHKQFSADYLSRVQIDIMIEVGQSEAKILELGIPRPRLAYLFLLCQIQIRTRTQSLGPRDGLTDGQFEFQQTEWLGEVGERTHLHKEIPKLVTVSSNHDQRS